MAFRTVNTVLNARLEAAMFVAAEEEAVVTAEEGEVEVVELVEVEWVEVEWVEV
jgi:hypothetical protein